MQVRGPRGRGHSNTKADTQSCSVSRESEAALNKGGDKERSRISVPGQPACGERGIKHRNCSNCWQICEGAQLRVKSQAGMRKGWNPAVPSADTTRAFPLISDINGETPALLMSPPGWQRGPPGCSRPARSPVNEQDS